MTDRTCSGFGARHGRAAKKAQIAHVAAEGEKIISLVPFAPNPGVQPMLFMATDRGVYVYDGVRFNPVEVVWVS